MINCGLPKVKCKRMKAEGEKRRRGEGDGSDPEKTALTLILINITSIHLAVCLFSQLHLSLRSRHNQPYQIISVSSLSPYQPCQDAIKFYYPVLSFKVRSSSSSPHSHSPPMVHSKFGNSIHSLIAFSMRARPRLLNIPFLLFFASLLSALSYSKSRKSTLIDMTDPSSFHRNSFFKESVNLLQKIGCLFALNSSPLQLLSYHLPHYMFSEVRFFPIFMCFLQFFNLLPT